MVERVTRERGGIGSWGDGGVRKDVVYRELSSQRRRFW